MARKNGCPTNIRDWQLDVLNPASTRTDPDWVRVKGNESMTLSYDSDTEDGSSSDSTHGENYKSKINGTLALECKRVVDPVTGERDPGQALLDMYMQLAGCDGDGVLRLVDPVGRATLIDFIVTSNETSVDETSESVSWDMDIVGEAEILPYVQATGVSILDDGTAITTLEIPLGTTKTLNVLVEPVTASNQRYGAASYDMTKVKVSNIDGLSFDVTGSALTPVPVNVAVQTKNNSLRAVVAVTVVE